MGRPKKEIKKEYAITIWVDAEFMDRLEKYCEKYDITKSVVCRNAIKKQLFYE